jgi:hypothetical protein
MIQTKCDQKSIEKDIEHASTSLQILFENHPGVPQVIRLHEYGFIYTGEDL